jgi:thiol:disulfide interchange protein
LNRCAALFLIVCAAGCSDGRSHGPDGSPLDFEEASKKARNEGKQLFVEFSAPWCGPCRHMKDTTFTDSEVRDRLKSYVELYVDVDHDRELAQRFSVRGIPAYVVLRSDGSVLLRGTGYRGPREFRLWLQGG